MNKRYDKKMLCAACALLAFMAGCATLGPFGCPYQVADAYMEVGERAGCHRLAGVTLTLCNETEKTVRAFTVSLQLSDADGASPFDGADSVTVPCAADIAPRSRATCVISLDPFLPDAPAEPYALDCLYLREITYTDGTRWRDPFGMYAQDGREE